MPQTGKEGGMTMSRLDTGRTGDRTSRADAEHFQGASGRQMRGILAQTPQKLNPLHA